MSTPTTEQAPAWFSEPERYCPQWCTGGHAETLEAGCGLEWASVHISDGLGGVLAELRNPIDGRISRRGGGGWDVQLKSRPGADGGKGYLDHPVVELVARAMRTGDDGAHHFDSVTLELTTGEARTLAAQLLRFADLHDLRGLPSA